MEIDILVLGSFMANCYILSEPKSKQAIIIDPGDEFDKIKSLIEEKNLSVKYIFITHAHIDHVSAAAELKAWTGAKILMHPDEQMILDSLDGQANLFSLPSVTSFSIDHYVKDEETISVDSMSVQVLATPGHSPGSISLVVDNYVFVGDLLFSGSVGRTDLPGGSEKVLLDSIWNKIMRLAEDTVVYPGHGPGTTVGEERRTNPFLSQWV